MNDPIHEFLGSDHFIMTSLPEIKADIKPETKIVLLYHDNGGNVYDNNPMKDFQLNHASNCDDKDEHV